MVQISAFVDAFLASFLGQGAVVALNYAQSLYTLPVSLFGMSVSAAELPAMSKTLGNAEVVAETLRHRLDEGLETNQLLYCSFSGGVPGARRRDCRSALSNRQVYACRCDLRLDHTCRSIGRTAGVDAWPALLIDLLRVAATLARLCSMRF